MSTIRLQGEKRCYYEFDNEKNILGEGGMGVVYLGKRVAPNGTETKVAIKELKIKETEIIERARREASIQLNNDNLVRMFGMIEVEQKDALRTIDYYVISEYLEGVMLDDVIEGKLENKDGVVYPYIKQFYEEYTNDRNRTATNVVKSILSGVMALHDAGFIHRDIDPTNIMVTSDGKIKLIDFGIAKKLLKMQEQKSELTTPGQFIGKAEYAAPELILGDTRHQNFYTDVYSVGVLYYQLVTGHVPFEGSKYDVIECQLHKKLPLGEITSWQIRDIIQKATEKKQGMRYASSALFRAAIDNIIYPEPRRYNFKKIGAIAAAVLLVICLLTIPGGKDQPEEEQAVAVDTVKMQYDLYFSELTSVIPDSIKKGFEGMLTLAEAGYPEAIKEVAMTYGPILKGEEVLLGARKKALGLKEDDSSKSQNETAIKWLTKAVEVSDSANYDALYHLSYYYVDKDNKKVKRMWQKVVEEAEKAGDKEMKTKIETLLKDL